MKPWMLTWCLWLSQLSQCCSLTQFPKESLRVKGAMWGAAAATSNELEGPSWTALNNSQNESTLSHSNIYDSLSLTSKCSITSASQSLWKHVLTTNRIFYCVL